MNMILRVLSFFLITVMGAQAGLVIDQTADQRVDDRSSDGTGSHKVGTNRLIGYHTSVQNMHVVYVFQMSGVTDASAITSADFSATQSGMNSAFNIDAHIIRYADSPDFEVSDYETTDTLLMEDFSDNTSTGSKALDAAARETLGTQLKANWAEGEYVFIGLKTDPLTIVSSSNAFGTFDADAQLTIYCGDEEVEQPEEPELTDLEQVLALGNLTNAPTIYTTNGVVTTVGVGTIQSIMYDGQDYTGSPTRVWAYIGLPEGASAEHPVPAVVAVHGGGGTAFATWVEKWNERGYAAISMDTEGRITDPDTEVKSTHAWSGPQRTGIYDSMSDPITDHFMYHATSAAILANSLMRSLPEVNPDQVGIVGVSWGGVITSTTIGLDDRFAFAVPTYGCGHLYDSSSHWRNSLENNETYKTVWDPVLRLANATLPVLWFSHPQETTFPMDSFAYSYYAAPGPRMVSLVSGMGHGHGAMWARPESYDFADTILGQGKGWCVQQSLNRTDREIEVVFETTRTLKTASLLFATGSGNSGDLTWVETNVTEFVESPAGTWTVTAELPEEATAWFVNATAEANVSGYRGEDVIASSDYQEVIHLTPTDEVAISHPVFTNETTATVAVAFTAPTYVRISDIQITNESHAGAFTNLTEAPLFLEEAAPSNTAVWVQFDNTVAGLANGESASATLTVVWDELDGSTGQLDLPLRATAWGFSNEAYSTWAVSNGLSGADAEMSADPDGNGRNNFMEYATGGDAPLCEKKAESASDGMTYVYHRRLNSDLKYTLETVASLDAPEWSTSGIEEIGSGNIDADYEAVTNSLPDGDCGFVRLTIEVME